MTVNSFTRCRLSIGSAEIEEMLDHYDSGMCDRTTSNAVALAFRKILKPDLRARVHIATREMRCELQVAGFCLQLPQPVIPWLQAIERNESVEPITLSIFLPQQWLTESAKESFEAIDDRQKPMAA